MAVNIPLTRVTASSDQRRSPRLSPFSWTDVKTSPVYLILNVYVCNERNPLSVIEFCYDFSKCIFPLNDIKATFSRLIGSFFGASDLRALFLAFSYTAFIFLLISPFVLLAPLFQGQVIDINGF